MQKCFPFETAFATPRRTAEACRSAPGADHIETEPPQTQAADITGRDKLVGDSFSTPRLTAVSSPTRGSIREIDVKKRTVTASALLVCALAMATRCCGRRDTDRARDLAATCAQPPRHQRPCADSFQASTRWPASRRRRSSSACRDFRCAGRRAATDDAADRQGSDAQIELIAGYFAAQK